MDNYYSV
jgi:hypothetical protein